jgi:hypothetical protein
MNFTGITGQIWDNETEKQLPAHLKITNNRGKVFYSRYKHHPGCYTNSDGSFKYQLPPGEYQITISRGITHIPKSLKISIENKKNSKINIKLQHWLKIKDLGWVNGNGHCHLYSTENENKKVIEDVRKICSAEGVDFINAAQGWAGYNDSNWKSAYNTVSDEQFDLHFGGEFPKYRSGHTWWLNINSSHNLFKATMDWEYENEYFQNKNTNEWSFKSNPFCRIPDVHFVPEFKKLFPNAAAIIPHPTSWWMADAKNNDKFTSNIASYLAFDLITGNKAWDGFAVMGYNNDHYFYQNTWFNILNRGYKMPAIAELDGGFEEHGAFYYGSMRTYFKINEKFTLDKVVNSLKKGHTLATSGPIIIANIDDKYQIGDTIKACNINRNLNIKAYSRPEKDEYLSYLLIFRNGEIYKLWDLRDEQPREFKTSLDIQENDDAWFCIKAYGKNAWKNPENLDVMKFCKLREHKEESDYSGKKHDVCITSAFYFRKDLKQQEPKPLISHINLTLIDPKTGNKIKKASIEINHKGVAIKNINITDGAIEFDMPSNAILKIKTEHNSIIRRSLFYDYKPHEKIIENLIDGSWLKKHNLKHFSPGEIPFDVFAFEKTKDVLTNVNWIIKIEKNERDNHWEKIDNFISSKYTILKK